MKNFLLNFLSRPFVIALPLAGIIIWLTPDFFSKYDLKIEKTDFYLATDQLFRSDLNGNGISERIILKSNAEGKASYLVHFPNDLVQGQYDFNGYFHHGYPPLGFADLDEDGYQEIYLTIHRNDSIFLTVTAPFNVDFQAREVFLDSIPLFDETIDLVERNEIGNSNYKVQTHKNGKRIIVGLMAGYLQYPRNIYSYDLKTDSLIRSAHLTNPSHVSDVMDIDGDGNDELLILSSSASNTLRPDFTHRSDASSWLTLLDDDLSFFFEPIEHPYIYSSLINHVFEDKEKPKIFSVLRSQNLEQVSSRLRHFSVIGEVLNEKEIQVYPKPIHFDASAKKLFCYDHKSGRFDVFQADKLSKLQTLCLQPNLNLKNYDIDGNGEEEWVGLEYEGKRMIVYESSLSDSLVIQLPHTKTSAPDYLGLFTNEKGQSRIYYQNRDKLLTIAYGQNPMYPLQFPIYFGIYLGSIFMVWGIMKLQNLQEQKKRAIEAKIADLQMKTIKNQVDPHFVFNALNAIGEMTLTENKVEADQFICEFADLMRKTLQGSDKISQTLREELYYLGNYIRLQRIRFKNAFDYEIEVDDRVDMHTLVPKQVLFTYVENAIKHGLSNLPYKGLLKIKASKKNNGLLLSVEDNGHGVRNTDSPKRNSTGSGLIIMEQIFKLYNRHYKKKIGLEFVDLKNSTNNTTGCRVEVLIS